jgi:hypothetical protein
MNNFSSYFHKAVFESKFRTVEDELISKVRAIVRTYDLVYRKLSKSDMKVLTKEVNTEDSDWREYFKDEEVERVAELGKIEFKDLATNKPKTVEILVAYGPHEASIANYDEDNNIITLFQGETRSLSNLELEAVVIHELTHGFQEYKTSSEPYKKVLKKMAKGLPYNRKVYFSEPLEFDAHITELAYRITEEYNNIKEGIKTATFPETAKVFQKRLEKFLLELKLFLKSDANAYIKFEELPLPKFFSTHQDFLETISSFPDLWKKVKDKLAHLYLKWTEPQT